MQHKREESIKAALAKKHLCYVLITCDASSVDGKLQVEMSYEGDVSLASYLLDGAKDLIDECHHDDCCSAMLS